MAISISTVFDTLYLTAQLPEKVIITTTAPAVEVTISLESTMAFSSVYYPYQNSICVSDIRSIIEAAMLKQRLTSATLSLGATEKSVADPASVCVDNIKVIYSALKSTDSSAAPTASVSTIMSRPGTSGNKRPMLLFTEKDMNLGSKLRKMQ